MHHGVSPHVDEDEVLRLRLADTNTPDKYKNGGEGNAQRTRQKTRAGRTEKSKDNDKRGSNRGCV